MAKYRKPEPAYRTPSQKRLELIKWIVILTLIAIVIYQMWMFGNAIESEYSPH